MAKILVCVTDAQLFLLLRYVLASEGFEAIPVTECAELRALDSHETIAAIVVDCLKPATDFDDLLAEAKLAFPSAAIILMARGGQGGAICTAEADLRLESPFNPPALLDFLHRLRLRLPKPDPADREAEILRFADLEMNLAAVKVRRAGREVPLTALQFRLLRKLLQRPTEVCERESLIEACWPEATEVELRTVDIHIGHIRRALEGTGPDLIRTVRGRGYALELPYESAELPNS